MKQLLLSATKFELKPLMEHYQIKNNSNFFALNNSFDVLISGIGMMQTCFSLTTLLQQQQYSNVLQAGVAGSFSEEIRLTEIVEVIEDQIGDLGAEGSDGTFLQLSEIGLTKSFAIKNEQKMPELKSLKAITVNTVSGNAQMIQERKKKFVPDIETMEGFALFYVCSKLKIPFTQIRSISNYIEPRDKSKWKLEESIQTLNRFLIKTTNHK